MIQKVSTKVCTGFSLRFQFHKIRVYLLNQRVQGYGVSQCGNFITEIKYLPVL